LTGRVEDWKSLKIDAFGELLRYGTFTVLKGDGGKDTEREVRINLFSPSSKSLELLTVDLCALVSHLSVRTDPALLQGHQSQQATTAAYVK
jgi:cell division control protein 24